MVLVSHVREYISRMLQDLSGMKVLILDSHTVSVVSVAYSQSELLQKEVFLVELIDSISKSREAMSHLKAIYFVAPTSANISILRRHLAVPRFGEYHLFFSNILKDAQIHVLADVDEHEVVQQVQLVQFLLKQAGVDKRTGDLFGNRDFLNIARNMARGLKGVENVYTQHQPLLFQTMESITKGRLRDIDYPFVGNHFQQGRPQDVIIFVVGGTTYEEARSVALQNAMNSGIRFILGGSVILNSKRFLKDLEEAQRQARSNAA